MRIKYLEMTNIKAIEHFKLVFDDSKTITEIVGPNESGKSTILNMPRILLSGKAAMGSMPLRKGEDEGSAHMQMGDYTFSVKLEGDKKPRFEIRSGNGDKLRFKDINHFISAWTFDPLAFAKMTPLQRTEVIREFMGEAKCREIDDLKSQLKQLESDRLLQGRDVKRIGKPDFVEKTEHVSIDALFGERDAVIDHQRKIDDLGGMLTQQEEWNKETVNRLEQEKTKRSDKQKTLDSIVIEDQIDCSAIEKRIEELEAELRKEHAKLQEARKYNIVQDQKKNQCNLLMLAIEDQDETIRDLESTVKKQNGKIRELGFELESLNESMLSTPEHAIDEINKKISEAKEHNKQARAYDEYLEHKEKAKNAKKEYERLDEEVRNTNKKIKTLLTEVNLPVAGLVIGEKDLEYDGLPWDELSFSRCLRLSMIMGMKKNPLMKTMFVDNAESLDDTSYQEIERFAKKYGLFILMASVKGHSEDVIAIELTGDAKD